MIDEIITTVSTFESQAKVNDSKIFLGHKASAVFHRDLHYEPFKIASASGIHFHFTNGQKVVDATGGAAVSCIGHGDPRVRDAISAQFDALDYCHSMFFSCPSSEELCQALINTTNRQMAKAYIVCSGVSSPQQENSLPELTNAADRFGGDGGSHETLSPILYGTSNTPTTANSFYCP